MDGLVSNSHYAQHLAEQAADQPAAELLDVLAGHAHARCGEEVLDVAAVELVAVRLADAIHQA